MNRRWRVPLIGLGLVLLVCLIFGQTFGHQFVNYDDPLYVLQNPHITGGLSWPSVEWAFTHIHSQNWHPLTSISHMIDCQIFGVRPGWHHLVNVLLHGLAAALLFLALSELTGSVLTSAFVAAVFAVHPLRVESVAWIAERKDVLSGVFFMLTLLAYARYVRAQSPGRYALLALALACGLMSKPMLVTTPVVLLLLDYWPLDRWRTNIRWLLLEKIPLLLLSLGSVLATLWAQNFALGSTDLLPLPWRVTNAIVSYAVYIGQTFWPHDLIPFYVHPEGRLEIWRVVLAAVLLLAITGLAIVRRKQQPYLLVGWFWYLIMLVPVIGIVQVGLQGHADRYTYLPHIGLLIALAWGVRDFAKRGVRESASKSSVRLLLGGGGALVIVALSILSWKQTAHWRDTETLWSYTLKITPDSDVAHTGLAGILFTRGRVEEAIAHYRRAIELRSGNAGAQHGLAAALAQQRKVDEAITHYEKALELQPDNIEASNALALLEVHRGSFVDAAKWWENTLKYEPEDGNALSNLAWLLATSADSSLRSGHRAVELAEHANALAHGTNAVVLRTLAAAYGEDRQFDKAIAAAEQGIRVAESTKQASVADDLRRYIERFREYQPAL